MKIQKINLDMIDIPEETAIVAGREDVGRKFERDNCRLIHVLKQDNGRFSVIKGIARLRAAKAIGTKEMDFVVVE